MAPLVWLGIAIALGFVEAAAPALVCIWFCLGAVITFVASFFVKSILAQIIIFVIASCVMLAALRPFMRSRVKGKPEDAMTNADAYIGREVVVSQRIPAGSSQTGRVLVADVSWLARTADGVEAPSGSRVRIKEVDSTVLVVEPV